MRGYFYCYVKHKNVITIQYGNLFEIVSSDDVIGLTNINDDDRIHYVFYLLYPNHY